MFVSGEGLVCDSTSCYSDDAHCLKSQAFVV